MGLDQEGRGLYQYVIEDESDSPKTKTAGPRVIKLDDVPIEKERKYLPPERIAIYLSKIELPELQPKSTPGNISPSAINGTGSRIARNGHLTQPVAPIPRRGSNLPGDPSPSLAPPFPEKKKPASPVAKEPAQTDDKSSRISRLFRSKS